VINTRVVLLADDDFGVERVGREVMERRRREREEEEKEEEEERAQRECSCRFAVEPTNTAGGETLYRFRKYRDITASSSGKDIFRSNEQCNIREEKETGMALQSRPDGPDGVLCRCLRLMRRTESRGVSGKERVSADRERERKRLSRRHRLRTDEGSHGCWTWLSPNSFMHHHLSSEF
jgi:hypothetical protein